MNEDISKAKIGADYKLLDDGMGLTIEALFRGMEGLVQSKTVVGEAMHVDGITIVPLIEVAAGLASGALGKSAKQNGAGAMSAKITPVALLILQDGKTRLINVKNQDVFTRLMDLIPEAVDKLTGAKKPDEAAEQLAQSMADDMKPEVWSEAEFAERAEKTPPVMNPDGSIS